LPEFEFVETISTIRNRSVIPTVVAMLTMLPALTFCGFWLFATPDLETWLAARLNGLARPDAFDGVADIAPLFAVLFAITSLLAACLVVSRKASYLLLLAAGPLLAGLVYVVTHGVTDPAWFTLLALLSIGMLLSSPVTAAHVVCATKRQHARPAS
jgi:hypothetical protein